MFDSEEAEKAAMMKMALAGTDLEAAAKAVVTKYNLLPNLVAGLCVMIATDLAAVPIEGDTKEQAQTRYIGHLSALAGSIRDAICPVDYVLENAGRGWGPDGEHLDGTDATPDPDAPDPEKVALEARVEQLKKALKPFADEYAAACEGPGLREPDMCLWIAETGGTLNTAEWAAAYAAHGDYDPTPQTEEIL